MPAKRLVVFIDDDKDDIQLFREIIEHTHPELETLTFYDPEQALAYLEQTNHVPYCIVCDFNMPKLDGFKLRSLLLKSDTPAKEAPFFILSTGKLDWEALLTRKLNIKASYRKEADVEGITKTLEMILGQL